MNLKTKTMKRIKTTVPVITNPFNPEEKKIIYAELIVNKPNNTEYVIEIKNYTVEMKTRTESVIDETSDPENPTFIEKEVDYEVKTQLRGKAGSGTPFFVQPKKISYQEFDTMIGQFEQAVTIPPEVTTRGAKIDFLALIVMLKVNNGEIPNIGETTPSKLCGVNWELDTIS